MVDIYALPWEEVEEILIEEIGRVFVHRFVDRSQVYTLLTGAILESARQLWLSQLRDK